MYYARISSYSDRVRIEIANDENVILNLDLDGDNTVEFGRLIESAAYSTKFTRNIIALDTI